MQRDCGDKINSTLTSNRPHLERLLNMFERKCSHFGAFLVRMWMLLLKRYFLISNLSFHIVRGAEFILCDEDAILS